MTRQRTTSAPRIRGLILVPLLLFLDNPCKGQSGRRAPRPEPQTATEITPTTDANASGSSVRNEQGNHKLEHKVILLVARQLTSKQLPSEATIYASFIKRLNEFTNVSGTSIGDIKRQQAILRAREETESVVVLLQFEIDNFQEGRIILNSPDLEVKYFIFAPGTGQEKAKGKVYYQAIGGAGMRKDNWPKGPPIKITVEAAGIEAAERVHDWLLAVSLHPPQK
ncbi:MAG: hypothetical protein ND895_09795 [Pyrinomonadaceae bacterium]|nr:hypothetical protein [Pyrinomonadaceae bacterium]